MIKHCSFLLLIATLFVAGCNEARPPFAVGDDKLPPGQYPRNVAVDPLLAHVLAAGSPRVNEGTKDQPMSVVQPVRNIKALEFKIQYQYTFLDSQGRPTEGGGGWKYLTLEPRVERFLEGAALDTNAVDWRLTVRPAQ